MNKPAVPTLKIKQTGRDPKTGTSRYTITLGTFRGTGTKAEVDTLRLMKHATVILDRAYIKGLFYYRNGATFAAGRVRV